MKQLLIFHAWHNLGICVLTPEDLGWRIIHVLWDKPEDELDLRLHYLGMAVNIPDKARGKWDKARGEWDIKWHKKLCHPNCAWTPENRDIFARGKSLARLLETPA